jgi:prevent-host-death family protein
MRIASLADVKARLSAYLLEVATTGPVVITRNGKAVAILLAPVDDDDLERLLLSRSPRFQSLLAKSHRSIRAGRGLTEEEFWTLAAQGGVSASRVREAPGCAPTAQHPDAAGGRRQTRRR